MTLYYKSNSFKYTKALKHSTKPAYMLLKFSKMKPRINIYNRKVPFTWWFAENISSKERTWKPNLVQLRKIINQMTFSYIIKWLITNYCSLFKLFVWLLFLYSAVGALYIPLPFWTYYWIKSHPLEFKLCLLLSQ